MGLSRREYYPDPDPRDGWGDDSDECSVDVYSVPFPSDQFRKDYDGEDFVTLSLMTHIIFSIGHQ